GRRRRRIAGPDAATLTREPLRGDVARPREGEHAAPLVPRDLGDEMRGGAEAVETEALRVAREAERAIAEDPGAGERGPFRVADTLGERQDVARVGDGQLRVAAVDVVAGEARARAEVLAPGAAEAARAARPGEPGDAHPVALGERRHLGPHPRDAADHLVPEDEG